MTDRAAAFMEKVSPEPMSGCWLWTGPPCSEGYGTFYISTGQQVRCHRAAWILLRGPIPVGKLVCHHCDNKGCVNPDHLYLGTKATNGRDAYARGQNPRRRLSPARVLALKERLSAGDHRDRLAKAFGIARCTLYRIQRGESYADVTQGGHP